MKRYFLYNCLLLLLGIFLFTGTSTVEAADAAWKAGRAKIEASGSDLTLRLSLRNEGKAGKDALNISGKWKGAGQDYKDLGNYTKEVALKKTAIIMVPLKPLGDAPKGASLEILIKTGKKETDRKTVPLP